MALLALLLPLLRRVPFAELVLRPARLGERLWVRRVVFAVAPAFRAPRFPCAALERPAFAPALLLVLARMAAPVLRPGVLRPALAFVPRTDLPALADLRPGLRAVAVRALRPAPAPARLRPLPSVFSACSEGNPIWS